MEMTIIILSYKMKGLVKNCLRSVFEKNLPFPFEIIVVDNDSRDGIEQMLREQFPSVKFLQSGKNLGMGAGNNVGIRAAQGKYILIINPDIFVLSGAIERLYNFCVQRPDIGLAAPRLLNPDRSLQHTCYRWHRLWTPLFRRTILAGFDFAEKELARFLMLDWGHKETREVDWIQGSCFLTPKKVFDEIGLFDERFFMYFEDTDLCRRIKNAGYKAMYLADAEVIHLHRRQSADGGIMKILTNKLTRIHIASWVKYLWKWRFS